MSPLRLLAVLLLVATSPLAAQEETDTATFESMAVKVPSRLAEVEAARSRACVPVFAALTELDADLQPLAERAERIRALAQALALEDTADVAPFDRASPLEASVADWFARDADLGRRWAESQDSALLVQRREARDAMRQELRDSLSAVGRAGQDRIAAAGEIEEAAGRCQGKILVRPAVLEVCDTVDSPVCQPARGASSDGEWRFVERGEDLWDVEQLSPWSQPAALARTQDGSLVGGRTAGSVRRGNVRLMVGVGYMLRPRNELAPEEVADFEANLDSMGFTFEHPDLVMAPALDILVETPGLLDGETHYLLHFGDLSDPATQVVWTVAAGPGGPLQASIPAAPGALARLQAGQGLSLTAVAMQTPDEAEGVAEAQALYTLPLSPVGQAPAVGRLLGYMAGGQFAQDLRRVLPPAAGGS